MVADLLSQLEGEIAGGIDISIEGSGGEKLSEGH
jgi:hypothetical protein